MRWNNVPDFRIVNASYKQALRGVEESFVPWVLRCSADFGLAVFLSDLGSQRGHHFCTLTLQRSESSLNQATSSSKRVNFSKITSLFMISFFSVFSSYFVSA